MDQGLASSCQERSRRVTLPWEAIALCLAQVRCSNQHAEHLCDDFLALRLVSRDVLDSLYDVQPHAAERFDVLRAREFREMWNRDAEEGERELGLSDWMGQMKAWNVHLRTHAHLDMVRFVLRRADRLEELHLHLHDEWICQWLEQDGGLERLPSLKTLRLHNTWGRESGPLPFIRRSTTLRKLVLRAADLHWTVAESNGLPSSLRELEFECDSPFDRLSLLRLYEVSSHLTALRLEGRSQCDWLATYDLSAFTALRSLHLGYSSAPRTDALLSLRLEKLPALEHLALHGEVAEELSALSLASNTNLRHLVISGYVRDPNIFDMFALDRNTAMRHLELHSVGAMLPFPGRQAGLKHLADQLAFNTTLERLDLVNSPSYAFSGLSFSDVVDFDLSRNTGLLHLSLATQDLLDDAGILATGISRNTYLREVNLSGTQASEGLVKVLSTSTRRVLSDPLRHLRPCTMQQYNRATRLRIPVERNNALGCG